MGPVIQVIPDFMPILLDSRILVFFHSVAHKAERHILRKLDIADWINETILEASPVLVGIRK